MEVVWLFLFVGSKVYKLEFHILYCIHVYTYIAHYATLWLLKLTSSKMVYNLPKNMTIKPLKELSAIQYVYMNMYVHVHAHA